ncbi:MAG: four helix bundle protein [Bacteroidia bacterium]
MATIARFEDLEVWKKSRSLANDIYKLITDGNLAKDFKLRDQMNGSSGSIMDNIAEGFERGGKLEFVNFLSIAKGSAGELRSQLYRTFDRQHIAQKEFESIKNKTEEVSKMISGFMDYLNKSELKGNKFKNRK